MPREVDDLVGAFPIRRELRVDGIAFDRICRSPAAIVKPYDDVLDSATAVTKSGRPAPRDAFFLRGPEGDLLGLSVGKALPPDVIRSSGVRGEIHPLAVGGPRAERAAAPGGPTWRPGSAVRDSSGTVSTREFSIHFHQQDQTSPSGDG